jgi:chromate transporter
MPTFRQALVYWLRLGCISFGGPASQIGIMHHDLVEKRRWISDATFAHALNFCMLLPGPEAQQLAIYLGWRLHGWKGGIAAGSLFVIPSVFILYALSWLYLAGGHLPSLAALFHGLTPAVIAVVAASILRIGGKALKSTTLWLIALSSFIAVFFFHISFIYIVIAAAALGYYGQHYWPSQFPAGKSHGSATQLDAAIELPPAPQASWARTATISLVSLTLWWLPVFLLAAWLGWQSTPAQQGLFFSKAALVTFGGAYAVLPYVAQQAVDSYGWLSHTQMMSGLALAETTPGPLIMVLQFVGFVGGWQQPGSLSPLLGATLGALITTWVTFLPCFFFVFLGAPHIEKLGTVPRISAALSTITAAVVGVMANLGVQFADHALWPRSAESTHSAFDLFVGLTALINFVLIHRYKIGLIPLMLSCAALGYARSFL